MPPPASLQPHLSARGAGGGAPGARPGKAGRDALCGLIARPASVTAGILFGVRHAACGGASSPASTAPLHTPGRTDA